MTEVDDDLHNGSRHGAKRRRIIRNPRPVVSCWSCRSRKLKCDREQPCQQCIRGGRANECTFASSSSNNRATASKGSPPNRNSSQDVESQSESSIRPPAPYTPLANPLETDNPVINELMRRVAALEGERQQPRSEPLPLPVPQLEIESSSVTQRPAETLKLNNGGSRYRQANYQRAMLEKFPEARDFMQDIMREPEFAGPMKDFSQIFKKVQRLGRYRLDEITIPDPCNLETLHSLVPVKDKCDRLVAKYFEMWEQVFRILDRDVFMAEYDMFWTGLASQTAPQNAQIGLQIAAILIVVSSTAKAESSHSVDQTSLTKAHCAKLLVVVTTLLERQLGRARIEVGTIQAQVLVILCEILMGTRWDEIWSSVGYLVRSAMKMGLHRDPSDFNEVRFPDEEQRRRLWATIVELELLSTSAAGMPCLTRPEDYNTRAPHASPSSDIRSRHVDGIFAESRCSSFQSFLARTQSIRLHLAASTNDRLSVKALDDIGKDLQVLEQQFSLLASAPKTPRIQASYFNLAITVAFLQRTLLHFTIPIAVFGISHPHVSTVLARRTVFKAATTLLSLALMAETFEFPMNAAFDALVKDDLFVSVLAVCAEIKEGKVCAVSHQLPVLSYQGGQPQTFSSMIELRQMIIAYAMRLARDPLGTGLDAREIIWISVVMNSCVVPEPEMKEAGMRRGFLHVLQNCRDQLNRKKNAEQRGGTRTANGTIGSNWSSAHKPLSVENLLRMDQTSTQMCTDYPGIAVDELLNFDFSFLDGWDFHDAGLAIDDI